MIFELTRDYAVVVPLMISNLVSFVISRKLQRIPIYEALTLQDGIHLPRPARDRAKSPRISSIMIRDVPTISADARFADLPVDAAGCVLTHDGLPAGAISRAELLRALAEGLSDRPAKGLLDHRGAPLSVHPDQPVEDALELLQECDAEALPVVERANPERISGIVTIEAVRSAFCLVANV
jgi:CIC family chloride channel protein